MNFTQFLIDHKETIQTSLFFIVTAFIRTAPEPGCVWNGETWYAWFYNGTHQALNMKPNSTPKA